MVDKKFDMQEASCLRALGMNTKYFLSSFHIKNVENQSLLEQQCIAFQADTTQLFCVW